MNRPLYLCSLLSFCVTSSGVVSVAAPLSVVREAVPSLLQDLHNEFRWSWSWWCCSPLYFSLGEGIFHQYKAVPVLELQFWYCFYSPQRFCFSKALQHGGRRKALLFRCQAGAQCRTCPLTGAAQLFLPSARTIAFNVWILHAAPMCSCSCSLSQFISFLEGATGQILW